MKKEINLVIAFVILLLVITSISIVSSHLEIKSVLLKFSVNKGDSITKNIKIFSEDGGEIKLFVRGIDKGVSLNQYNLVLDKDEEAEVKVLFDSKSIDKGVYVGHIEFQEEKESKIVPVIFEVESKDKFFDANLEIPPKYSEISPKEEIRVTLKIFDLTSGGGTQKSVGTSLIDVEYTIHDLYGNKISSENEQIVIDGQSVVTKTLTFPENIKNGQYVFSVIVKYKSSIGTSTDLFSITDEKSKVSSNSFFNIDNSGFIFILIFMAFIFLVLILFFAFMIYERNKLFLELKRYNSQEIRIQKRIIRKQARLSKKKHNKKEVKREIKKKIKKLRIIQKARIKEFKKLKKRGKTDIMKSKLQKWKREGYKMIAKENSMKNISEGTKNSQIRNLKKKGFNTDFLEK